MKKSLSRNHIDKKNKTLSLHDNTHKSSRLIKADSCIKIQTINSQQISKLQNSSHVAVSQKSVTQKILSQLLGNSQINKPAVSRTKCQKQSQQTIVIKSKQDILLNQLRIKNQQLSKQNAELKQKCCQLQQNSLNDKEKIKNLIIRIKQFKQNTILQTKTNPSEMKSQHPSSQTIGRQALSASRSGVIKRLQTPNKLTNQGKCENKECLQRKKYLQGQLYRERINRDRLENQKKQWQRNRLQLKEQYGNLLVQIRNLRNGQF